MSNSRQRMAAILLFGKDIQRQLGAKNKGLSGAKKLCTAFFEKVFASVR